MSGKVDKTIEVYNGDLDNLKTTGFYMTDGNTTNKPDTSNYFIEVLRYSVNYVLQRATLRGAASTAVYVRNCNNGTWYSWIKIF